MRGVSLVPSTIVRTLVCIDEVINLDMAGRFYNIYIPEPVKFSSVFGLVRMMDGFFDEIAFPQSNYDARAFNKKTEASKKLKKEVQQHMSEDVLTNEQGKKASFMVQVQFRQNATWQGTITWMEEKKSQHFRSTLEMIKLMDNALVESPNADAPEQLPAWK